MSHKLIHLDYIVEGKVQGVYFRKYTRLKAKALNLVGYVKNEINGSVVGAAEGEKLAIASFKDWLKYTGSPGSVICHAHFKETEIDHLNYERFDVLQ